MGEGERQAAGATGAPLPPAWPAKLERSRLEEGVGGWRETSYPPKKAIVFLPLILRLLHLTNCFSEFVSI